MHTALPLLPSLSWRHISNLLPLPHSIRSSPEHTFSLAALLPDLLCFVSLVETFSDFDWFVSLVLVVETFFDCFVALSLSVTGKMFCSLFCRIMETIWKKQDKLLNGTDMFWSIHVSLTILLLCYWHTLSQWNIWYTILYWAYWFSSNKQSALLLFPKASNAHHYGGSGSSHILKFHYWLDLFRALTDCNGTKTIEWKSEPSSSMQNENANN